MADPPTADRETLHDAAYAAMGRGDLGDASRLFAELIAQRPDDRYYHYMRGLALKYSRRWQASLEHNLRAAALAGSDDCQAERWNGAIAATAIGDWDRVRQLWRAEGLNIPEGTGPIDDDFGVAVVRLHPWKGGETVFMRRIDPVRARLLNVPLPESGHRFGDIVLHDGAVTGYRFDGGERKVPVFNELERLIPSEFRTFVVFVGAATEPSLDALLQATAPGIGMVEDWTDGISYHCLRCSYGTPHRHPSGQDEQGWQTDRNLGIAAQSRRAVEKLLADWSRHGRDRRIDGIECRECPPPEPEDGHVWWRGPDEDESDSSASGDE